MMLIRRQMIEHPFGTLKSWMGATHIFSRTLDRVSTEMSLHMLAYNLKRVLNLLGSGSLMAARRPRPVYDSCHPPAGVPKPKWYGSQNHRLRLIGLPQPPGH